MRLNQLQREKSSLTLWEVVKKNYTDHDGKDTISFRGTAGVGDFQYALNVAFMRAFLNQKPTNLTMHWFHDKDFLYHYEDPETIIERFDYSYNQMMWKHLVNVEHVFESNKRKVWRRRYYNVSPNADKKTFGFFNVWPWSDRIDSTPIPFKVTLWRPTFNGHQNVENGKMPWDITEWEQLILALEVLGYSVQEIDYRTPIREVFYHLRTADLCIAYEGMWNYVAKNFYKPTIVIGAVSITNKHTPFARALPLKEINNKDQFYTNLPLNIEEARQLSESALTVTKSILTGYPDAN